MKKNVTHPGIELCDLLDNKGISQRELAAKLNVAHSILNNILKGNRNINVNIAMALESAGFKDADYWYMKQMKFNLYKAKNDKVLKEKSSWIKEWNSIEEENIVPLSYLRKQNIGISTSEDIGKVYDIYDVNSLDELKKRVFNFNPTYFRKSSKFTEDKNNIVAWSILAKYKAKQEKVAVFNTENEQSLLQALKKCFYKNENIIWNSKIILNKYGIKFLILDRPSKTPVDGKSFMCGDNPTIALSLKYKRVDNFAFTLFHELGHVFKHLTNPEKPEFRKEEFFINSPDSQFVEFEADSYARNNLINQAIWNEFITAHDTFSDKIIFAFSKKHKIHPGIVRGRVCFEYNEYYRKRTSIAELNKL